MSDGPFPNSRFNDFLSAPIGPESWENQLSVISALVRLGFDPLEEAALLSRLPRQQAVQRLASLIVRLPGMQWAVEPVAIAARLIDRLPAGSGATRPWTIASGRLRSMIHHLAAR